MKKGSNKKKDEGGEEGGHSKNEGGLGPHF